MGNHFGMFPSLWPLFKRYDTFHPISYPHHNTVGTRPDGRRWWHRRAVAQGDADMGGCVGVRRVCDHLGHHRILHTFPWEGVISFITILNVFVALAMLATWSGLPIIMASFFIILLVLAGIVCSGSKRSIRRPCLKPWRK